MVHEFGNLDLRPCKWPETSGKSILGALPFRYKVTRPKRLTRYRWLILFVAKWWKYSLNYAYESESIVKGKGWVQHTKDKNLEDVIYVFSTMPKRHMSTSTTFWMTNLGPCSMVVGKAPFVLIHSLWNGVGHWFLAYGDLFVESMNFRHRQS